MHESVRPNVFRIVFAVALTAYGCAGGGTTSTAVVPKGQSDVPPGQASYVQTVVADHPIAFYRLMERSGTVAHDSSGNGYNGAFVKQIDLGQPALLKSDQTSTSVSFPAGYASEQATWTTQAVSAECWIRPTSTDLQNLPRIIDNAWTDHNGNGFMMWISAGTVAFNTGWIGLVGPSHMKPGHVYHVVGTYDNTTGASLYINGLEVRTQMAGQLPNPQKGDSSTTYIGVLNAVGQAGLTDFFQGDIADCAVYDHALTPGQVANHYNAGADAHETPAPTPTPSTSPTAPPPTPYPSPISYDSQKACINNKVYANNVLPQGEGEFASNGLDRTWWGRERGNPLGGNQYSGFQTSWGRHQYDTYFGDSSDGLPGGHDPFYVGADGSAPGSPHGVRIEAIPMPSDLQGNPNVGGAHWYSGVLDTPVDLKHGFYVARVRVPPPAPGMSPAWWMLTNNGVPQGSHGPLNGEWDIQEMFGALLGNGMNMGSELWNSGSNKPQNWGGTFDWPSFEGSTPSQNYHDYGILLRSGGAPVSKNYYGPGGPGYVYGTTGTGLTNYLDGIPLYGHTGGANITEGVSWKELMAMFQVGAAGSWLGTPNPSDFPAYYWIQWIRVYQRTEQSC